MDRREFLKNSTLLSLPPGLALPTITAKTNAVSRQLCLFDTVMLTEGNTTQLALAACLHPGEPLELRCNPLRPRMPDAVEVIWREQCLGILPRDMAVAVGQLLRRGLALKVCPRPITSRQSARAPLRLRIDLDVNQVATPNTLTSRELWQSALAVHNAATSLSKDLGSGFECPAMLKKSLLLGAHAWLRYHDLAPAEPELPCLQQVQGALRPALAQRWHLALQALTRPDWEPDSLAVMNRGGNSWAQRQADQDQLYKLNLQRVDRCWLALCLAAADSEFDFPDLHGSSGRLKLDQRLSPLATPNADERQRLLCMLGFLLRTVHHAEREKVLLMLYLLDEAIIRERGHRATSLDYFAWQRGPIASSLWEEWEQPAADLAQAIACAQQPRVSQHAKQAWSTPEILSDWECAMLTSLVNRFGQCEPHVVRAEACSDNSAWMRAWRGGIGAYRSIDLRRV
jgi:hypothetical protein